MRDSVLAEQLHGFVRSQSWQAAVLPFGATEPHNLHMPYGTDTLKAEEDNPYKRVMIVPFTRLPEIGSDPVAEHACVLDIQDRINMGVLSRISAERYAAWRQKHVSGHKFAKKKNPDRDFQTLASGAPSWKAR
jgi:hypothetical protein